MISNKMILLCDYLAQLISAIQGGKLDRLPKIKQKILNLEQSLIDEKEGKV